MAAPEHVPVLDDPRHTGLALPPAVEVPRPGRPAEPSAADPRRSGMGSPGPDQGYALLLAQRFRDRLHLVEGEHAADVLAGAVAVATVRASLFGRAPVIHDLDLALTLWGFLVADAPDDLVAERRARFAGASHHYWDRRTLVESVPVATLRLTPDEVRRLAGADWRSLLGR